MSAKSINRIRAARIISICVLLFTISAHAQNDVIDFESDRWNIQRGKAVEHLGQKSFMGMAILKDVEFENGIIEVDMACEGSRSFVGIFFRVQSPQNYENFYLRPHKSNLPDALQYQPVTNGQSNWQLYNGEGFTASVNIPHNSWIHVKMEISGTQARVFLDHSEKPALVIDELIHGVSKGTIGVAGPANGAAHFANFKYSQNNNLAFDAPPSKVVQSGLITEWELSQVFPFNVNNIDKHPDEQNLGKITWQKVSSEPGGLVNIARFVKRTGNQPGTVFTKTIIHTDTEQLKQLWFGYSDIISVFLNGKILFTGNSVFRSRDASFLGAVGLNDAVYLPLKKGENELLLMISESFGGWGFICRDGSEVFEHASIKKIWKIEKDLINPESVVYDKAQDVLYVTNFDRYAVSGEGKQFISKVSLNGKIEELQWVKGLSRPLGMTIFKDKLFVVERQNVAEIDIDSGEIINRYPIPQPGFPNDIAIDASGNMYVTDSPKDIIYKYGSGKFEVWLEGDVIDDPNGLLIHTNKLIVGTSGDHSFKSINLVSKEIKTLAKFSSGIMDGVKIDKDGNYLFSHWDGRLYRVTPSGEITKLLETPNVYCADFDYISEKNLLIIPTLEANSVMMYSLK